jgi:hypothetical protein
MIARNRIKISTNTGSPDLWGLNISVTGDPEISLSEDKTGSSAINTSVIPGDGGSFSFWVLIDPTGIEYAKKSATIEITFDNYSETILFDVISFIENGDVVFSNVYELDTEIDEWEKSGTANVVRKTDSESEDVMSFSGFVDDEIYREITLDESSEYLFSFEDFGEHSGDCKVDVRIAPTLSDFTNGTNLIFSESLFTKEKHNIEFTSPANGNVVIGFIKTGSGSGERYIDSAILSKLITLSESYNIPFDDENNCLLSPPGIWTGSGASLSQKDDSGNNVFNLMNTGGSWHSESTFSIETVSKTSIETKIRINSKTSSAIAKINIYDGATLIDSAEVSNYEIGQWIDYKCIFVSSGDLKIRFEGNSETGSIDFDVDDIVIKQAIAEISIGSNVLCLGTIRVNLPQINSKNSTILLRTIRKFEQKTSFISEAGDMVERAFKQEASFSSEAGDMVEQAYVGQATLLVPDNIGLEVNESI